ncbi:MAG: 16S rRNA (cytidine(1402)-2'-O)-methyltransferase [Nanoarchaeota archaeon]
MLYIVATPIGNLDDLSLRQAKTITYCEILLAEDTRSAKKIIDAIKEKFGLSTTNSQLIQSFYKENEFELTYKIIKELEQNKNIAIISESGLPLISDPGGFLVNELIKRNLKFTVIPGPTALTTALVHSGFNSKNLMFIGFMPKKDSEVKKITNNLLEINKIRKDLTIVFYESIHRINNTLKILDELIPNANVCICREMTKKFEEILRGKSRDLMNKKFKGEITVAINLT